MGRLHLEGSANMNSAKVEGFFSCSFLESDKNVNDFFRSISQALDIQLCNVDSASANTPPNEAKRKLDNSQALIAICTKRDKLASGDFVMPQAVHDEISFAYGKDIPVLMFVEDGVDLQGFKRNFGTYLSFDRQFIFSPEFLEKSIRAIHELKLQILAPHQLGLIQGISESHADYVHHSVELKYVGADFMWEYNTSKKLIYSASSKRGFPLKVWASVPALAPNDAQPISWDVKLHSSTNGIKLIPKIEKQTPNCVEVMVKLEPNAESGDYIEYSTFVSSRFINPVWLDEATDGVSVHLDDREFRCADGLILIHRTRKAVVEFRIAREYGLKRSDFQPFVGSYTSAVDYEVSSELQRSNVRIEDFGGNLVIRMEVESPLPGHIYGIAWNPPVRTAVQA